MCVTVCVCPRIRLAKIFVYTVTACFCLCRHPCVRTVLYREWVQYAHWVQRQKLLIMQIVEQVGLFSICSGRLEEMLMMQCADPNTLPAPSRLCQLGQSLSLSPSPSVSFINPYPSFHFFLWLYKKRGLNCISFFNVLLLPFSLSVLKSTSSWVTWSYSQTYVVFFLASFFHTIPSCSLVWKMPIECAIRHWVSQESKAKILTHVVQKRRRHKGWWNHSPLADRGENCAENVSQIK